MFHIYRNRSLHKLDICAYSQKISKGENMKIKKISVVVSKSLERKDWQDGSSKGNRWGLTYGADADLSNKDDPLDSIIKLDEQLRELVQERLTITINGKKI